MKILRGLHLPYHVALENEMGYARISCKFEYLLGDYNKRGIFMLKKLVSLVLALVLLLSGIPPIPAQAQTEQPLDVQQMDDGSYVIELKDASDYSLRSASGLRRAPQNEPSSITPETDPDKFTTRTVRVDFGDLVNEVLKVDQVKLTVENKQVGYSREYTVTKDGDVASGDKVIGQNFDVPVPAGEHYNRTRFIVHFPDGRDARALVEGWYKPLTDGGIYVITVSFLAHTGVATEWYGASERPNVQAVYTYIANGVMPFDLPTKNQNTILREGNFWEWAGHDNPVYLEKLVPQNIICTDHATADYTYHVKINGEKEGQLGTSNYFFKVTGDAYTGFTVTSREKVSVDFNAGKGSFTSGQAPATQYTGHSLKLNESFIDGMGPISVPAKNELTVPAAEAGQPKNEFKGWSDTENGQVVDMDTYVVEKNTTFYAIYGPKAQGAVSVKYVDENNAEITDPKYHIAGQDYSAENPGNVGETVGTDVASTAAAPKFLGYKVTGVDVTPAEGQTTATYTDPASATVTYKYEKLKDIIPAKTDDGTDNPDATPDVKATYKTVTMKVDGNKGTFQKGGSNVAGTEFVYYVNPVEGKSLDDVLKASGLTAKSKDENANKINAAKPWTFDPAKTKANADVATSTVVSKDNFDAGVTMAVNFAQTKADQFKDKLKAVDIKVWKGEEITWKKGVALKDANEDLQKILDDGSTVVSDLGEGGTIDAPKTARTSTEANLPNGAVGNLKVTFDDGSSLAVNDQTVYVAPEKTKIVDPSDPAYVDPDKLPDNKVKVDIQLGEGVQAGTMKGDKTTPVVYASFYLKPNTGLADGDFPAVEAQEGYKQTTVAWDPSELTKTWDADGAYVATATAQTIAEKVGQGNLAGVDFGVWKGETIDWKKGVKVADTVTDNDLKTEIEGYLKDAKTKVTDATTPARSSDKVGEQKGNLTVTFSDGSTLTIKDQTLYVWEHKTENNDENKDDPKPANAVQVSFKYGTGVTAITPADKTMTVKSGTALVDTDFPTATVDAANGYVTPAIWTGNGNNEGLVVSKTNNAFTATANKGKSDKPVIPYEPTNPTNPTDKNDPKIPTEDDNHKTIDKNDYVNVAFNVAPEGSGTLTLGKIADKAVVSALVKKGTDWSKVTLPTTTAKTDYTFWYWTAKTGAVADGDIRTAHFIKSGDEIQPGDPALPDGFFKVTVGQGDGVKDNALFGKSYAVKEKDKLAKDKFPPLEAKDSFKDPKWYDGETAVADNKPEEVAITGETTFTAKATEVKFDKDHLMKIEFTKDPTKMTYTERSATDGKMKLDGLEIKLTDENGVEKTIGAKDLSAYGVTVAPADGTDLTNAKNNGKHLTATAKVKGPAGGTPVDTTVNSPGTLTVNLPKSDAPTINQPTAGDKTISGKGVPGATIVVEDKDGQLINDAEVDKDGKWSVDVPKDKPLKKGDKITATQTEQGKTPTSAEATVKGKTSSGGSSGGGSVIPSKPEPKPEKPSEGDLNKDDHYQYLIGYPDGTFAPNKGMTRAEVATMFTRLLKDRPVKGESYKAGLSDVHAGDWYADTVGYAVQKGIVSGYPDGSFKPNQAITRAEFASIASRFAELTEEKDLTFSDLDASHWGYKAIRLAASNGWISGYPDNTFRPEQAITRAEVTSITNRMLNRSADLDWINAHSAKVIHFSDVSAGDWFFEPVMEASMGHDFTRDADGKTEHWTGLNGKSFI